MNKKEVIKQFVDLIDECEACLDCENCELGIRDCHCCIYDMWEYRDRLKARYQKLKDNSSDNVNHPKHYETGKFECIDVMLETQGVEAVKSFCICNAFKYLYRHGRKNGVEDVKKAIWYLNKFVELEEGEK